MAPTDVATRAEPTVEGEAPPLGSASVPPTSAAKAPVPGDAHTGARRAGHWAVLAGGLTLALYLFVLSLRLLSAAAGGVGEFLGDLSASGPLNLVGFGWLLAYGALSGSPVAALALSLVDGGAITTREGVAMLSGSRLGASLIVLLVGFAAYVRGRGRPDGIYVGVLALLTTATVYIPATLLALGLLDLGWFDGVDVIVPSALGEGVTAGVDPLVDPLADHLPGWLLFVGGAGTLLAAFWVFDRLLPNLDPPSPRIERLSLRFSSPRSMFLFGALITAVTMSVAISVTILVPLTMKGVVRRQLVIPYIMGANITTFVDTFVAASLLETGRPVVVVLVEILAVTTVCALILLLAYRPYSRALFWLAHEISSSRRALAAFLVVIGVVPLALIAM